MRCANSISTFFRRREASTYCRVAACATSHVAGVFVLIARDSAGKSVRAAEGFEFAGIAIQFAGAISPRPLGRYAAPGGRIGSSELNQFFARGAGVAVAFGVRRQSRRGRTCRQFGLICRRPECVWRSPWVRPAKPSPPSRRRCRRPRMRALCRSASRFAPPLFGPLQPPPDGWPAWLRHRRSRHGRCRSGIIGVGEEGASLVGARPLGRRIGSRDEFRRHRRGCSKRCVIERGKALLRGAGHGFPNLLGLPFAAWNRSLLVGVGRNQAGVNRKPVGADQALCDAPLHHALEQPTQSVSMQIRGPDLVLIDTLDHKTPVLRQEATRRRLMTQNNVTANRMSSATSPSTTWKEQLEPGEHELFERFARNVLMARQREVSQRTGRPVQRALHVKLHAGLMAEFQVLPDLPRACAFRSVQ